MGLMTGVGQEKEYERGGMSSKMNVIQLETDRHKIECALFAKYVDELNSYIESCDGSNPVVFVLFAKVKTFKGNIVLQNALYCTKLIFNPNYSEAVQFRKRLCENNESPSQGLSQLPESSRINVEDDFLVFTPRMTIKQLKDCKKDLTCVVLATIKHVDGDDWWYSTCTCNRAVYPEFNMFFCGTCNRHVRNVIPRYRIKLQVMDDTIDDTGRTTFVLFDRDACFLLNKTCAEMVESVDKNMEQHVIPSEIAGLVEKTFLFKVAFKCVVNTRFAKSFCVKRVCNDPDIVQKFKDLAASDDLNVSKRKSAEGDINQCDGASTKIVKRNIKIEKE